MARIKGQLRTRFVCRACGSTHPKWMGKCPDCGAWDSLDEVKQVPPDARRDRISAGDLATGDLAAEARAVLLADVDVGASGTRLPCGIGEFDRVLGGGLVPGMAVLVGGEPGIGKSTLLLQAVAGWARSGTALYVTSEESARQTRLRADRLGIKARGLLVLAETNLDRIVQQVHATSPAVVVVDSIQMVYKAQLDAAPGSVTQLREACMDLVYLAKSAGCAVVVVGHVTKQGTLAGPKLIEHVVDTVVYFEGDRYHAHRVVRCVKNRFGGTHEIGLFEMTGRGLDEVTDPGRLFAEHYQGVRGGNVPSGSVLAAVVQGSRVLLVEVQALTAASVIGAARRKVSGYSADRVAMILAVLEKRADLKLAADDVFVNVAGGVKVTEPAADLAVALAIASAHQNRPLAPGTLALGELGLGGEVRPVPQVENRLLEASRLGVGHAIVPPMGKSRPKLGGTALLEVRRLDQAMAAM